VHACPPDQICTVMGVFNVKYNDACVLILPELIRLHKVRIPGNVVLIQF
jgi:hypothetical protein